MQKYSYPIRQDWSTEELIDVMALYNAVEAAYEGGVPKDIFGQAYRRFKEIVPSKSQEKQIDREFQKVSGYSIYRVFSSWREVSQDESVEKLKIR